MAKVQVKLNWTGVQELMKSEEMQTLLEERAKAIEGRCGEGYTHDVYVGSTRANAMILTDTAKAYYDNLRNNTILKNTY